MGWEIRGERGPELLDLPTGMLIPSKGSPHIHGEYVEGCFRCDLSREEADGVR